MFVNAWEFRTAPEVSAAFAKAYGPDGEWVRLLRNAPGYVGTEALQDIDDRMRFLIMDRWADENSFRTFRANEAAAYEELDQRCLSVTASEEKVGKFVAWDGKAPK